MIRISHLPVFVEKKSSNPAFKKGLTTAFPPSPAAISDWERKNGVRCGIIIFNQNGGTHVIKLVNVSKFYSTNNVIAIGLRKVNLELRLNEFVAIVGESGSGKTTLLNVICGIDTYEEGEIFLNGKETSYFNTEDMENFRKKYVAFVFQNYNLIESYTVLQNVEAPMILSGYSPKEARTRALAIIERVGLTNHLRHRATRLSGGQKQRVVIARALAKDCPIIAADEPTGNLDSASGKQILELLHEISKDKLVILVTHDFDQVKQFATRKVRIYDGEIVEDIQLKPSDVKPLPDIPDSTRGVGFWQTLRFAAKNLLATPKKTFFLLLVLFSTTFLLSWTYAALNRAIAAESGGGYVYYFADKTFLAIDDNRLVARKTDGTAFTDEEIGWFRNAAGVKSVLTRDYVLDTFVMMDVDFYGYEGYKPSYYNTLIPESYFGAEEPTLQSGRMPEADDEIVIILFSEGEYLLSYNLVGLTVSETIYQTWQVPREYEIVGVLLASEVGMENVLSDYGLASFAYLVTDDLAEEYADQFYFSHLSDETFEGTSGADPITISGELLPLYTDFLARNRIIIDDAVPDDTIRVEGYQSVYQSAGCAADLETCSFSATGTLTLTDFYGTTAHHSVTLEYSFTNPEDELALPLSGTTPLWFNPDEYPLTYTMSSQMMAEILPDEVYQLSAVTDDAAALRTLQIGLNLLHPGKLVMVTPAEVAGGDMSIYDALSFFFVYLFAVLGMGFVTFLSLMVTSLITRLVYNTKLRDYAIFRTIGANQGTIRHFIFLENLMSSTGSFLLFLPLAVYLQTTATNQYGVFYGFTFFRLLHYLVLFALVLILSLLNSRKYCRRVFQESVNRTLKAGE